MSFDVAKYMNKRLQTVIGAEESHAKYWFCIYDNPGKIFFGQLLFIIFEHIFMIFITREINAFMIRIMRMH